MKIFFAAFLLGLSLTFWSCSKKSDPDPASTPTKTDLISASAWTYVDAGIDQNRDGAVDAGGSFSVLVPSLVPSCRTDNTLTFKKDNTGVTDEGATKCSSGDAQSTGFNWSFADNETNINVSNNVFALVNGKSKIYSLTTTQFSLTRDTTMNGTTVPVVVILKH